MALAILLDFKTVENIVSQWVLKVHAFKTTDFNLNSL
jgi:hypothetical protein